MSNLSGWQRWFSESEVRMAMQKFMRVFPRVRRFPLESLTWISGLSRHRHWDLHPRVYTMKSYRREDANLERIRSQFVLDRIKTEAILWKRSDAEETQRENGGVGLWKVSFVINYMTFLAVVVSARNRMSNDVWQRPHRARPATALAHTLHYPPRK